MTAPHEDWFPTVAVPVTGSAEPAIRFLVDHLANLGRVRPEGCDEVIKAILHREQLGSTGIGHGVAVPHAKTAWVDRAIGVIGQCQTGIPWNSVDGAPVHVICLFLVPTGDVGASLRMLERIAREMRRPRNEP
jgi:mannitol/fructose-specific phosphotransferase system IIA component (Ntr-type)